MDAVQINIRTISPIFVPIELKTGVDRSSTSYVEFQSLIHTEFNSNIQPRLAKNKMEYESIEKDSWEHKLFTWQDKELAPELLIHIFPNNIGIAVIDHTFEYTGDSNALEKSAQNTATQLIEDGYAALFEFLKKISNKQYGDFFRFDEHALKKAEILWVSRAILTPSKTLSLPLIKSLTTEWLKHTYRPADAEDILAKVKTFSMTWLNYIIVDFDEVNDERLASMILAQYYYAAQEKCNKLLKQAIDTAYSGNKKNDAQQKLGRSRVTSRLHQVDYHEHLKYLTKSKCKLLKDILKCWEYDQLTKNGQRMIEICSSKIDETENIKRERSSLLTDLLLVALSFFTVFELSLYLTEFSREMVSRPTLDFNDDSRSFIFQFIADIDADVMFGSGFVLTLLLVFVYKILKSR